MKKLVCVVTGTGHLSLGESIALNLNTVQEKEVKIEKIITISRSCNHSLEKKLKSRGFFIECDLNPLNYNPKTKLSRILKEKINIATEGRGIDFLFNCAGIYDFGFLNDISYQSIIDLFGVNIIGFAYLTKTIMGLNKENNSNKLSICYIGSVEGVNIREKRSIYSTTKMAGLHLCQSLLKGGEVDKSLYAAPGPIDTPLLHYNHWVTKAGGDPKFIDDIFIRNIEVYNSLFIKCHTNTLRQITKNLKKNQKEKLEKTFYNYSKIRKEYQKKGVASAKKIAASIVHDAFFSDSGVYLYLPKQKGGIERSYSSFND